VVTVPIGSATADIQQLYPAYAAAGAVPATATPAQQVRYPCEGQLISMQVASDGVQPGIVELYDISGMELGIDVSSLTAITDAQLDAAISAGTAKLMLVQNFAGSGLTPWAPVGPASFMKGLAVRVVGASGTCTLNLVVHGGYRYLSGSYRP
jgi:hypothetical protein